jgi:hypothetical protein
MSVMSALLLILQVNGSVRPVPELEVNSLAIRISPGLLNASAAGSITGTPVAVQLTSTSQGGSSTYRIGSIRVTSSSGASLDALLAGQAAAVSTDVGVTVPRPPREGYASSSTDGESSAELVFDSTHGLRLLNISLANNTRLGVADIARRVGFSWQGNAASTSADPISFSAPWLYYVPAKPNATNITWAGRQLVGPELGVAATVDVPSLGINATRASLLVHNRTRLSLQVCALFLVACSACLPR